MKGGKRKQTVDQALPTDGCSGLFEVDAHEDVEVVLRLVGVGLKESSVLESRLDVVDRARSNNLFRRKRMSTRRGGA